MARLGLASKVITFVLLGHLNTSSLPDLEDRHIRPLRSCMQALRCTTQTPRMVVYFDTGCPTFFYGDHIPLDYQRLLLQELAPCAINVLPPLQGCPSSYCISHRRVLVMHGMRDPAATTGSKRTHKDESVASMRPLLLTVRSVDGHRHEAQAIVLDTVSALRLPSWVTRCRQLVP